MVERGALFNLVKINTKWKSSSTKRWRSCSRGSKTYHPGSVEMIFYQSRMIYTVHHLLVKTNKWEGRGELKSLKREEGLIDFLPLIKGGLFERGTLIEDLRYKILNHHTAPDLRNSFVRRNIDQVNYHLHNRATQSHFS